MCVKTVINTLLKKLIATIFPKNDAVPLWFNCNMSLCNTVTSQFHHRRISSILQVIVTTQFHHRRISSILYKSPWHVNSISVLYKSQWHVNSITVKSHQFFTSHSAINSRSICSCDQHLRQRNYTVTLRFRIQEREMWRSYNATATNHQLTGPAHAGNIKKIFD